jgi:hypothetical protein
MNLRWTCDVGSKKVKKGKKFSLVKRGQQAQLNPGSLILIPGGVKTNYRRTF